MEEPSGGLTFRQQSFQFQINSETNDEKALKKEANHENVNITRKVTLTEFLLLTKL